MDGTHKQDGEEKKKARLQSIDSVWFQLYQI